MKFLVILTIAALTVAVTTAAPNAEKAQKQAEYQSGFKSEYGPAPAPQPVQGRAHSQQDAINQQNKEIEGRDNMEQQMNVGLDDHGKALDRSKKSYGHGKCGKAVVVGCAPIVQKVKCKGSGGHHAGAYTAPIPQYAHPEPEEYVSGPFIQYI